MIISLFQQSGGGGAPGQKIGITPPTVTASGLVYNGTAQSPTIGPYNTDAVTVAYTPQTNAGTYTVTIALKDKSKYVWLDTYDSENKTVNWSIAKATGTSALDKIAVELGEDESDTVTVTRDGDGEIIATSSDTTVCTVSVSGNVVTISDAGEGTATVSISVAAGTNYEAVAAKTVVVEVSYGPEIVTWASGTDAQIVAMVEAADAGKIDLTDYWSIGDKRSVSLSAMAATGVGESHRAQNVVLLLADKNNSNYEYVTATSGRTYCNFVVHQESCLASTDSGTTLDSEIGYMNSSGTNAGGWNACARRTWCNNVYYNAIPSTLKSIFKQVKVKAMNGGNQSGTTLVTSNDYCFLPAAKEVFYGTVPNDTYAYSNPTEWNALSTWKYYETKTNRVKKMGLSGVECYWWERSPYRNYAWSFCFVYDYGSDSQSAATSTYGLAPSGCI